MWSQIEVRGNNNKDKSLINLYDLSYKNCIDLTFKGIVSLKIKILKFDASDFMKRSKDIFQNIFYCVL